MVEQSQLSFFGKPRLVTGIVAMLFVLGFGIRLVDLTDLPLDFHPTRQFLSAVKARGMYYQYAREVPDWQREMAVQRWKDADVFEPAVNETVVAGLYLLFGEHLWIARVCSSVYWLLGGLALFALARRIASIDGAIVGLTYYLFLGFGIFASRSFQPDPLMVSLTLCSLWAFYRWQEAKSWKWAIFAGLSCGLAIFVKVVAVFPLLGAFALSILLTQGLRRALKDPQVWALALLSALPVTIFIVDSLYIAKNSNWSANLRFFPDFWIDPMFYVHWKNMIANTLGFDAFLVAVLGIFLARPGKDRPLLLGLFVGYFAYGFMLAYHITTHNYYQLPLFVYIPLSLAVISSALFQKLKETNTASGSVRLAVVGIILFGISFEMWNVRVELVKDDYRAESQFWVELGEKLGHSTAVVGLTQDYGSRLAYWGWKTIDPWPTVGDQNLRELAGKAKPFDELFAARIEGKQYFLVTNFNQFDRQVDLKDKLYSTFPVIEQSPEFIIFDLQNPKEQQK